MPQPAKNLVSDAKEWSEEQATGEKILSKLKEEALSGPMSRAEEVVISLVLRAHIL